MTAEQLPASHHAVGEQAGVRDLVQQIIGWLPPEARTRIEDASEQVSLDFEQDVDRSVIPPRVRETVERALNTHRKLAFHYLSPRRADHQPVYHELAPYQLRFQDGHWYLRGYDLNNALGGEASFLRFRLSYILDDVRLRFIPTCVGNMLTTHSIFQRRCGSSPRVWGTWGNG